MDENLSERSRLEVEDEKENNPLKSIRTKNTKWNNYPFGVFYKSENISANGTTYDFFLLFPQFHWSRKYCVRILAISFILSMFCSSFSDSSQSSSLSSIASSLVLGISNGGWLSYSLNISSNICKVNKINLVTFLVYSILILGVLCGL